MKGLLTYINEKASEAASTKKITLNLGQLEDSKELGEKLSGITDVTTTIEATTITVEFKTENDPQAAIDAINEYIKKCEDTCKKAANEQYAQALKKVIDAVAGVEKFYADAEAAEAAETTTTAEPKKEEE